MTDSRLYRTCHNCVTEERRKFSLHSCQLGVMGTSTPNSSVKSNLCTTEVLKTQWVVSVCH